MPPSNISVIYNNAVDDAVSLAALSEVPTLPAEMLRTQQRSEVWRSTGCAAEVIDLEFSRPLRPDYFGLINHNLSSNASIRVQFNTTADFAGAVVFDETIRLTTSIYGYGVQPYGTLGYGGTDGSLLSSLTNRIVSPPYSAFLTAASNAARFGKITFNDPLNPDGYLQLGRLYCAQLFEFSTNYDWGTTLECIDTSNIITTPDGIDWPDKHARIFQRSLKIGKITSEERFYALMDFWLQVGLTDYFIIIIDPSTATSRQLTSHYCRLVEDPQITDAFVNQHDITLKFKEVR